MFEDDEAYEDEYRHRPGTPSVWGQVVLLVFWLALIIVLAAVAHGAG
ncbi:MAG TPA: hypothetical protein VGH89_37990 [Pseudonocardia sp.]|jgi:hypothetical protein